MGKAETLKRRVQGKGDRVQGKKPQSERIRQEKEYPPLSPFLKGDYRGIS
jgi:hypothetical protein